MFVLARIVEQIWESIRTNKEGVDEDGRVDEAAWTSPDPIENGMVLFTLEHLKYVMARGLQDRTMNITDGNRPIAWWTTQWRHHEGGRILGYKFHMRENHVPPQFPGVLDNMDLRTGLERLRPMITQTVDRFWDAMKLACRYPSVLRFDYILLYRLVYHHISITCPHRKVILHNSHVVNALSAITVAGINLNFLWDNNIKCKDHVKNHLNKKGDAGIREMRFFKSETGIHNPDDYHVMRATARRSMIGVTLQQLLEMFDSMGNFQNAYEVPILTDALVAPNVQQQHLQHVNNVGPDFSNLALAIDHSCTHGIISNAILEKLLECRLKWNLNREVVSLAYQSEREGRGGGPTDLQLKANVILLETAGFPKEKCYSYRIRKAKD
jgi:hypothetical protein